MTLILNTTHAYTIRHSFLPARRISRMGHRTAPTRRTSSVLSQQELRQIVQQMVD
jgi:hypothetical protein